MRVSLSFLCCLCCSIIFGQSNKDFKAFPGDSAGLYKFDLHKNYFINDDLEYQQRMQLITTFQKLEKKLDEAKSKGKNVHTLLYELDSLQKKVGMHSAYLGMFPFINTANPLYQ